MDFTYARRRISNKASLSTLLWWVPGINWAGSVMRNLSWKERQSPSNSATQPAGCGRWTSGKQDNADTVLCRNNEWIMVCKKTVLSRNKVDSCDACGKELQDRKIDTKLSKRTMHLAHKIMCRFSWWDPRRLFLLVGWAAEMVPWKRKFPPL